MRIRGRLQVFPPHFAVRHIFSKRRHLRSLALTIPLRLASCFALSALSRLLLLPAVLSTPNELLPALRLCAVLNKERFKNDECSCSSKDSRAVRQESSTSSSDLPFDTTEYPRKFVPLYNPSLHLNVFLTPREVCEGWLCTVFE